MRVRNGAIAIACGVAATFGCSLFVSLDDLESGSSDASTSDAPIANDAISPGDSSSDAPTNDGQVPSGYSAAVLADKPLAYFHLDEASGTTLADSSGNGHDATSTTVFLGGAGAFAGSGSSAHFDGNAFAEIPDSVSASGTAFDFANTSPFSLEAWVKIDHMPDESQGEEFTFLSKEQALDGGNFYGIDFFLHPQLILQREDDPINETETPSLSTFPDATSWHYVVATYDGATITVFVDNVSYGARPGSMTMLPVTNVPFLLGAENALGGSALVGSMDEVAIYASALTLAQRTTHFSAAGH